MTPEEFAKLNEKHPYLTSLTFNNEDLIGIIQNTDNKLLSIYAYNDLTDENQKKRL